jgi:16S rRNA (guanine527-N7)-methyltransferase
MSELEAGEAAWLCRTAASELGAALGEAEARRLLAYLDAMLAENEHVNLTGVRGRADALVLHVLDGLAFAATGITPRRVLDLGSGNGFPGVAVAALHPAARTVLCDRTRKKVAAIDRALRVAGFERPQVETLEADAAQMHARFPHLRGAFDTVLARAVGAPDAVAELAAPLLGPRGQLVLWLAAGTPRPERLPGGLRFSGEHAYALKEPAPRRRFLATWRCGR